MSADNYYTHPYCSNSSLSQLKQDLSARDAFSSIEAFRLGTLQDNFITERAKLDHLNRRIDDYQYIREEWNWAKACKKLWDTNPITKVLTNGATFQKEYYVPGMAFEYEMPTLDGSGKSTVIRFNLDCRCKFDGFIEFAGWGWDLKSTPAGKSYHDCLKSIETFDYDRAAYFYMKVSGSDRMPYIFITKDFHKPQMHIVFIKRGDKIWESGRQKCNELAYKYWMLNN